MSEGLAAGEIVDVLAVADKDRPEISVLSDEFLDSIAAKTEHPNVQIRLLEKLLKDEIRSVAAPARRRPRSSASRSRRFSAATSSADHKRRGRRAPRRDRQEPARRSPAPRAARADH